MQLFIYSSTQITPLSPCVQHIPTECHARLIGAKFVVLLGMTSVQNEIIKWFYMYALKKVV